MPGISMTILLAPIVAGLTVFAVHAILEFSHYLRNRP